MAEDIQSLVFPINTSTPGIIKTYKSEVNKQTGAMVVYDTTNLGQKDPVLRSDPIIINGIKTYKTDIIGTPSAIEKQFLTTKVSPAANNQRAAFINKNYTLQQKNTLFAGVPGVKNTASATIQQIQQGGVSQQQTPIIPTGQTEAVPLVETGKLKRQLKISPDSGLTYPLDRKTSQDRIKFQAYKILPRTNPSQGSSESGLGFTFGDRNYQSVDGPVFLSIQAGINDQNSVDWGPDSVNAIDSALYSASLTLMKTETEQLGQEVGNLAGNIQKELRGRGGRFGRFLAGQAAGINNILARTDNVVLNPNLELLFQGPQLRPFSFQFKLSAREKTEAEQIKKIIKYFKYHMSTRQEEQLFLRAPNVFEIEYQYGTSSPHPGLNLIKKCALTNCSVDYTPLGSYATYEDGTMIAYTLSLQFQELEPIYDTDYTDPQSIGF